MSLKIKEVESKFYFRICFESKGVYSWKYMWKQVEIGAQIDGKTILKVHQKNPQFLVWKNDWKVFLKI